MGMLDFNIGDIGETIKDIREAWTGETIVDPIKQAEVNLKLKALEQALLNGQIEVNKAEALHPNIFVAGWRPAIGWVAAVSIALMYIPKAIMITYMWSLQCLEAIAIKSTEIPIFPDLGATDILGLVGSLLGIAAMRSYDKRQGTDTKKMK